MNRWYGGMVHELGHAFGLPDSSSTDGTPMSASFYNYPNTHFSQAQKNEHPERPVRQLPLLTEGVPPWAARLPGGGTRPSHQRDVTGRPRI